MRGEKFNLCTCSSPCPYLSVTSRVMPLAASRSTMPRQVPPEQVEFVDSVRLSFPLAGTMNVGLPSPYAGNAVGTKFACPPFVSLIGPKLSQRTPRFKVIFDVNFQSSWK